MNHIFGLNGLEMKEKEKYNDIHKMWLHLVHIQQIGNGDILYKLVMRSIVLNREFGKSQQL